MGLTQNYFIPKLLYTNITLYQHYFIPKLLITKMFPPQTTSSTMYGFTVIPFIDNRRSRLPPLETTGCAHVPCERDVVCPLSQLGADGGQCGRNLLYEHAARLHDQAQLTGTLQHPLRVGPRLDEEVADPEAPHVLHDAHAESGRYDEICPGDGSGDGSGGGSGEGSGSVVRVRVKVTRSALAQVRDGPIVCQG